MTRSGLSDEDRMFGCSVAGGKVFANHFGREQRSFDFDHF